MSDPAPIHATCVAIKGKGVLLTGPSGSGKSGLALTLMAFGAELVADDRVILRKSGSEVIASCPQPLVGMIEARGVGLLRADQAATAPLAVVIDMAVEETDRLPPRRHVTLMGVELPLLRRTEGLHFAPAIVQFLAKGRAA